MGILDHSVFQTEVSFGAPDHDDYYVAPKDGETKVIEIMWSRVNSSIYDEAYYPHYNMTVMENGEPVSQQPFGGGFSPLYEGAKTLPAGAMDDVEDWIRSTQNGKYKNYGIRWGGFDPYEFPDDFDPIPIWNSDVGKNTIFSPVVEEEVPETEPIVEEPAPEPEVVEEVSEPEPETEVVVDEDAIEATNEQGTATALGDPFNPELSAIKSKLAQQEMAFAKLMGMFVAQKNDDSNVQEETVETDVVEETEPSKLILVGGVTGTALLVGLGYYFYNKYK